MIATISPSTLSGKLVAPASKSSMQRACAAALLHQGLTILHNPGISNDDRAALDVIHKLGATVEALSSHELRINSKGVIPQENVIACGESGLGIRMFTPIAALSAELITITGSGSLATRPMHFFDEIFPALGIAIRSNEGKLPLQIHGPLMPADIEVDGSLSSQFLTGLLMAYSSAVKETVTITVNNLKSKPYIDLTLKVMEAFGMNLPQNENYEKFVFKKASKPTQQQNINYTVEGDWSGASFLLVAGAIAGKIIIKGLDIESTQADKAILLALEACGCHLLVNDNGIEVAPKPLQAFTFNATDCPDLFPPLVALAAYCNGISTISGVSRLAHKESDRALTLQEEFAKMGVVITLENDEMYIHGTEALHGAHVHSHHDHRIAMACTVAALQAAGNTTLSNAQAIDKSYPQFFLHMQMLGASIVVD